MAKETQWVLADINVLPSVVSKVLKAKELIASGEAETAVDAAQKAGLSRSAFYKYKDMVFPYQESKGELLTTHMILQDKPGILSSVLSAYANAGANILTVNQNIPSNGTASISISARIERLNGTVEEFVDSLQSIRGVEKISRMVISQGE